MTDDKSNSLVTILDNIMEWTVINFIHVLFASLLMGSMFSAYFLVTINMRQQDQSLLKSILKTSILGDFIILSCFIVLFITGPLLIRQAQLSLALPWVRLAFVLTAFIFLLWAAVALIKWINLRRIYHKQYRHFKLKAFFHVGNLLILVLFALIVHDAVTRTTFF